MTETPIKCSCGKLIAKERDGKIYPINAIPPKPHPGCRCWYEEVRS